jgi:hypothetical protein
MRNVGIGVRRVEPHASLRQTFATASEGWSGHSRWIHADVDSKFVGIFSLPAVRGTVQRQSR